MTVTFDTHKQFKSLTTAGFTEPQAEAIVYILAEICHFTKIDQRDTIVPLNKTTSKSLFRIEKDLSIVKLLLFIEIVGIVILLIIS